jgi:hypothetical protein
MPIQADSVPKKPADPFDFGSGRINPDKATKFFNCTLGPKDDCSESAEDLYQPNLPSIVVPNLKQKSVTVWRTVTNVAPQKAAT